VKTWNFVWLDIDSRLQTNNSKWLDSTKLWLWLDQVMTLTRQKWLGHITGLSTNIYCDKLEEIADLIIFSECFRGPLKTLWRATCGPRAANCPSCSRANFWLYINFSFPICWNETVLRPSHIRRVTCLSSQKSSNIFRLASDLSHGLVESNRNPSLSFVTIPW